MGVTPRKGSITCDARREVHREAHVTHITRISRLRGCGVFRNFMWPSDLADFGRYNLIYGWNGSGKTTISRLFRDLELGQRPGLGEAVIRIKGSDVRGESFPQSNLQVRVFNRDFIHDNVFPLGRGEMSPILVLGAENVEKLKKVQLLTERCATVRSDLDSARSEEGTALEQLDQFCIDRAGVIRDTLRSSGQNPYNNYNKSNFRGDAEKMVKAGDSATHRLTDAERGRLLTQRQATQRQKVTEFVYALPDFNAITDRLSELLTTTVVSAAIEVLKSDHELADWTRKGLSLHRDRNVERCQFCEQPLPEDRLAALEAHFSTEYGRFIQVLDHEINVLDAASKASAELRVPTKAELYDDLGPAFQSAEIGLMEAKESAQRFLGAAVQALEDKKRQVFEPVKPELEAPRLDVGAAERLNAVIRKHNQACDDFETRVQEARQRLAADMIAAELEEFVRRNGAVNRTKAIVQSNEDEVQRLDGEIAKLEGEIVEHRRPAEELNEDLRSYLGHNELCLEIKETGYTITRGGVPAKSLSEGERTAIALLYFLKSLQDRRFEREDGVVVLDDPVSSLDANALFLAFGFVRERTKDAGQLFILTHNFSFFRQVRNWFHHLRGQNKKDVSQRPARFFMLDSLLEGDTRSSVIRWLDPLLEQFESEYQYLFARVQRASTGSVEQRLEQNYALPNIARRMLEAFLAFRLPQTSGDLWRKLKVVPFDEAKKLRILRFLHTHSHSIAVGEPEHDLAALAEAPAVLRDLLEMMKSLDDAHCSAMVQLVAGSADTAETGDEAVTA